MIDLFLADGIGGSGGPNAMLQNLARPLVESGRYESHDVLSMQSIGPANRTPNPYDIGPWFRESTADAALELARAVDQTRRQAAVGGYSGGAAGVSKLLADIRAGKTYTTRDGKPLPLSRLEIVWAVTVANPYRSLGPDAPGYGIAGEHRDFPHSVTHFEVANPDDAIPCCPQYSPLRTLTDMGQDGVDPRAWLGMIERGEWQDTLPKPPSDPLFWIQPHRVKAYAWLYAEAVHGWLTAGHYLRGYLDGTAHGSDYVTRRLFDEPVRQILAREWE